MTSAQVVETSVKVTLNSPSQDYTHPYDRNLLTNDMTPGFKPFTFLILEQFQYIECCKTKTKINLASTMIQSGFKAYKELTGTKGGQTRGFSFDFH